MKKCSLSYKISYGSVSYTHLDVYKRQILDSLQQAVEPIQSIGNCEHICQNFAIGVDDEAIVLIFRDIDANRNQMCIRDRV